MGRFFCVYPASNGTDPLVRGPFDTVDLAAEERQVNGDIVCVAYRPVEITPRKEYGDLVIPATYRLGYMSVVADWLWPWEDETTSPFAFRYATNEVLIY